MIILASSSPRRRELLSSLGLSFDIIPAVGPENTPKSGDAASIVKRLALDKASEVAASHFSDYVIGADTVVEFDGNILGKPKSRADSARMLRALSGREHHVYTGLAVIHGDSVLNEVEKTSVFFRPLEDCEIDSYISSGEPDDKAGAYAIQGLAALFIEGIKGDYFNVVGLPLCRLGRMLDKLGVKII